MDKLKIDYVPLSQVKKWPGNAREWDLNAIYESINEFGFRDPLAVNSRNNQIEEGHGRVNVLAEKKSAGDQPPKWVYEKDDEWFIPVMWFDDEPEIQHRYAIGHNRTQDIGNYDNVKLTKELQKLADNEALKGTGYTVDDLKELLKQVEQDQEYEEPPEAQMEKAQELQEKWRVKMGDLWEIGQHRLLCGDATKKEDVERLMDGGKVDMVFTDPPYGVDYSSRGDKLRGDKLDEMPLILEKSFKIMFDLCRDGAVAYVWHTDQKEDIDITFKQKFVNAGFFLGGKIVWVKNVASMGWNDYRYQYEPCLYGWKGKHKFYGDRTNTNVWQEKRDNVNEYKHPTQKPCELGIKAIINSSIENEIILDCFL